MRVLLIAIPENIGDVIHKAFQELGWEAEIIQVEEEQTALQRLIIGNYNMVFLNAGFLQNHPKIEQALFHIPIEKRRNTIFILIDAEMKTFDQIGAFVKNVNAVINVKDLPYLSKFLPQIVETHDALYRGFQKIREELELA
ncbi:MAG: hypothetical protein J7M03_03750 [Candidatus Desulfofervidaceae bacterium]|nr:hypothetical protein [Candidatus Desulfofervidaceae bacterium]